MRNPGYTIVEILVAMSLLILLGGGLVTLLHEGISMWRSTESQGRAYERARAILDQLARDLRSAETRSNAGDDNAWVRFLCDADPWGRQRLRFVRSISGETEHPILREGGRLLGVKSSVVYDGHRDAREAERGALGAPAGLMEVLYCRDPRRGSRLLWRGVRTPIGGPGSLFHNRTVEDAASFVARGRTKSESSTSSEAEDADAPFADVSRPLSDGVLFLGFSFWGPTTNTWEPAALPLKTPRGEEKSGPLFVWDSTRAILDQKGEPEEFTFRLQESSLEDPGDDIFPAMVEVTLVLREDVQTLGLRLSEKIDEFSERLLLSRPVSLPEDPRDRFLLVEDEWIAVEEGSGRHIVVASKGRGVRDTEASRHDRGAPVDIGLTFRRVLELPGYHRDRLRDEGLRKNRRRSWR